MKADALALLRARARQPLDRPLPVAANSPLVPLAACYVVSVFFFDKAIAFGYDAPFLYAAAPLVATALATRAGAVPRSALLVALVVTLSFIASASGASDVGKELAQYARFVASLAPAIAVAVAVRSGGGRAAAVALTSAFAAEAVLALVQVASFAAFQRAPYLPVNNLTYIESGDAMSVAGGEAFFRATGTFGEPSWLAYYLGVGIFATGMVPIRRWRAPFALLLSVGLLATGSFSGILMVAIAAIAALIDRVAFGAEADDRRRARRMAGWIAIVLAVTAIAVTIAATALSGSYLGVRIVSLLNAEDGSLLTRWSSVEVGWDLFLDHPITGVGAGNSNAFVQRERIDIGINSGLVLLLAEFGCVGAVAMAAALAVAAPPTRRTKASAERIFFLANAVSLVFYSWVFHPLFWLSLAFVLVGGCRRPATTVATT